MSMSSHHTMDEDPELNTKRLGARPGKEPHGQSPAARDLGNFSLRRESTFHTSFPSSPCCPAGPSSPACSHIMGKCLPQANCSHIQGTHLQQARPLPCPLVPSGVPTACKPYSLSPYQSCAWPSALLESHCCPK